MKKLLTTLFFILAMFINPVFADITNQNEIDDALAKLDALSAFDPFQFCNKTELIGYRRDQFNMATDQYRANVIATKDMINRNVQELDFLAANTQMTDSQKNAQHNRIYQDINGNLSNLDSATYSYVNGLRWFMPSLTYQNYYKRFIEYYKSLNIKNYQ